MTVGRCRFDAPAVKGRQSLNCMTDDYHGNGLSSVLLSTIKLHHHLHVNRALRHFDTTTFAARSDSRNCSMIAALLIPFAR